MNTAQAKEISLISYLSSIGYEPSEWRKSNTEAWYCSPFRNETEPSFKVNLNLNTFFDFSEDKGGTIIDFVMMHYDIDNIGDALKQISGQGNIVALPNRPKPAAHTATEIEIKKIDELKNKALINYLEQERCISVELAKIYLVEVYWRLGQKHFFALGMKNCLNGFEVRNEYYKGCIGIKSLTLINDLGAKQSKAVSVFEGFMDFLSLLQTKGIHKMKTDVIILNGTAQAKSAIALAKKLNYKTVFTFLDWGEGGNKARGTFTAELGAKHVSLSDLFYPHDDMNDFLVFQKTGKYKDTTQKKA